MKKIEGVKNPNSNRDGNLWIDGYLYNNLEIIRKAVKDDRDSIIAVDGYEGSGKSVLAFQVAAALDNTFDINRICFTAQEFAKKVTEAEKFTSIVYDEARSGLNARRSMSSINVTLTNMLAEIRQKNLYIILVLPSFFDLDKNVAIWRSMALLHVLEKYDHKTKSLKRGYFKWFNRDEKKYLYVAGKKFYNYKARCSFEGQFKKFYPIDVDEYKKRKAATLKTYDKELNKQNLIEESAAFKKTVRKEKLELLEKLMKERGLKISVKDRAEYLGVHRSTLYADRIERKSSDGVVNSLEDNTTPNTESRLNKEGTTR